MRSRIVAVIVGAAILTGGYAISQGGGGGPTIDVYVGQSSAGSGDGSSCANEKAATFFNTAGNWGAGNPIAPGKTVGLCGTITSTLTAQADGSSGNPVTIYFTSGAKLSQAVCAPCLNLDSRNYITVDGGSNGIIESNANGTNLANHTNSTLVSAEPCSHCEVKNLTLQNAYVIASGDTFICASGCVADNAGARCIKFAGHDWLIHDNTMHDASWCVYENADGTDGNNRIYNNNIYNFDHGWQLTGTGPVGNEYFYGNHLHDMGTWDPCDSGNPCHHDGIHCEFGTAPSITGLYIYNNLFDGTLGTQVTSRSSSRTTTRRSAPTPHLRSTCSTTRSRRPTATARITSRSSTPASRTSTTTASSVSTMRPGPDATRGMAPGRTSRTTCPAGAAP